MTLPALSATISLKLLRKLGRSRQGQIGKHCFLAIWKAQCLQ